MPGVSRCRDCGVEIWWHPSPLGRVYPPLVKTGQRVLVLVDGVMHNAERWELHKCNPEEVAAFVIEQSARIQRLEAQREEEAELHSQAEERGLAMGAFLKLLYARAMEQECPKCRAVIGEPCENLTERRSGRFAYTVNPHPERADAIPADRRPYWTTYTRFIDPTKEETPPWLTG